MGIRFEHSGVHCYARRSGIHVLLDEVAVAPNAVSVGPRTLSIAVTDSCDFRCLHCHVKKGIQFLSVDAIMDACRVCESLGTLDVALGGGEPTLHPEFVTICRRLWAETQLGVSVTTHGHHLTESLVGAIRESVSFVRVSIDGVEPTYSRLRGRALGSLLERLSLLRGMIPFGINTVVCTETLHSLDEVLKLASDLGAEELLLLPVVIDGLPRLSEDQWKLLNGWIRDNQKSIALRVGTYARPFLEGPFLFADPQWEQDYAYLATDGTLRESSYSAIGVRLSDYRSIEEGILAWRRDMKKQGHFNKSLDAV